MRIYDEYYGDIWFDEEDPNSINYNPAYCRNVYLDLASGYFDFDDSYYDADDEYDDYDDF